MTISFVTIRPTWSTVIFFFFFNVKTFFITGTTPGCKILSPYMAYMPHKEAFINNLINE
jgi:hypothetical protein